MPNLILSYQALHITKYNEDFFGSPLKTFALEIVELTEKLEEIKKNIRTWGCRNSRFRIMAL